MDLLRAFYIAAVCLIPLSLHSQSLPGIESHVIGDDKKPVISATVSLLRANDSMILRTTITGREGKFTFRNVPAGSYILGVSSIGFREYFSSVVNIDSSSGQRELPSIELQKAGPANLKSLTVKATHNFIEQKIDRVIVNPDGLISNRGVSAWDVLQSAPGVIARDDGAISLAGKSGLLILIDERPTYLSGADLAAYLRSLPSDAIDKIEIMTNPPARFDAAGNAGIINIRMKKARIKGFNGTLNAAHSQGVYPNPNGSFIFNYRIDRLNISGIMAMNANNDFISLDNQRTYLDTTGHFYSSYDQHMFNKSRKRSLNGKLSADYYLSKNSTAGVILTGFSRNTLSPSFGAGYFSDQHKALDSFVIFDNYSESRFRNYSLNLNYRHAIDSMGSELTVDADHAHYSTKQNQSFTNADYLGDDTNRGNDTINSELPTEVNIYSIKSNYSRTLKDHVNIEGGVKSSYTQTDNAAAYFNVLNSVAYPDYNLTNHFIYRENVNALYANFNKEWKSFSFQLGLRLENTISRGHQLGNSLIKDSTLRRVYTNLFPTIYLLHKFDEKSRNQLILSYSERIDRPGYNDLNPFVVIRDKFTSSAGNAYLQPVFTHTIELKHVYKNFFTTTLSWSYSPNDIDQTIQLIGDQYFIKPGNIGKTVVGRLAFSGTFRPATWWTIVISPELQYRHYNSVIYGLPVDTGAFCFNSFWTSQFSIGKTWAIQLSGFYRGKTIYSQLYQKVDQVIFLGMRKKLWNNKLLLRADIRDIFYTHVIAENVTNLRNGNSYNKYLYDSRVIGFGLTYSFGKAIKNERKHDESSADEEKNRVK